MANVTVTGNISLPYLSTYNDTLVRPVISGQGHGELRQIVVTFASLTIGVFAIVLNGLFVAAYLKDIRIRTPFNIYLLNLATADIGYTVFEMSGRFLAGWYGHWPAGRGLCTIWLYSQMVFPAAQVNSVFLISLDRLVAVSYPVWYWEKATKRRSLYVVLGMWIWLNVYHVPGLVVDRQANRAVVTVCELLFSLPVYALWMNIVIYVIPQILLITFCFVVSWKIRRRFRLGVRAKTNSVRPQLSNTTGASDEFHHRQSWRGNAARASESTIAVPQLQQQQERQRYAVNNHTRALSPPTSLSHPALLRRVVRMNLERKAFWTLMALATATTLFWFPADIYYFLLADSPVFESVQLILGYSVTILNPLFYHALNQDIRRAVRKVFP